MGKDYLMMMDYMGDTDNLEIFNSEAVISLIQFKKDEYADRITKFSSTVHSIYVLCFVVYLNNIMGQSDDDSQ